MARNDTLKVPSVNNFSVPSHSTEKLRIGGWTRGSIQNYIRLILALSPDEVLVIVRVGIELLGEKTGLPLFGLGVLFVSGQVEDQVCDDEGL